MEILKGNRLTIFDNKIVVDKNLPKKRRRRFAKRLNKPLLNRNGERRPCGIAAIR